MLQAKRLRKHFAILSVAAISTMMNSNASGQHALDESSDRVASDRVASEESIEVDGPFSIGGQSAEWKQVLPAETQLPTWAAYYADSMPKTTIAMMRLDDFHRRHSPLGNRLAALLRWQVAKSLDCKYAIEYAKFDLQQTGYSSEQVTSLEDGQLAVDEQLQRCLRYAEKLTKAGFTVTDEETTELLEQLGPQDMVAVVQTIAFANFQYRLMIATDAKLAADEPMAAFFPHPISADLELPKRKSIDDLYLVEPSQDYVAPESFTASSTEMFVPSLEMQQQRTARITIPDDSRISRLDEEDQESANRITWSRVAYGYQPEMTRLWFQCLRAYQQEAKPDSFFLNSVFWVVTRSNECFY